MHIDFHIADKSKTPPPIGLYIHIPFCGKACNYCNFHFTTSLHFAPELIQALCMELELRKSECNQPLQSVYLGGGTPGILDVKLLEMIFHTIHQNYALQSDAEITMEVNPENVHPSNTKFWFSQLGINRLSVGIQSFQDHVLQWMNRSHNSKDNHQAIACILDTGFQAVTADLIYGIPGTVLSDWQKDVECLLKYPLPHFSAYALTVEQNTPLFKQVQNGKAIPPPTELQSTCFEWLMERAMQSGYQHYEISNFAKPNHLAQHNTGYWKGMYYLGIGPSAHSYTGTHRSWNIANNAKYIHQIQSGNLPMEQELITPTIRYNEYVMTGLRTQWGVTLNGCENCIEGGGDYFLREISNWVKTGHVLQEEQHFTLHNSGKLMADRISSDVMMV